MKLKQDFTIASLVRGSFLGVLGVTVLCCGFFIGKNGGNPILWALSMVFGFAAVLLGNFMFARNFER